MAGKLRTLEALNAAKRLVGVYRKWVQADGPNVVWKGAPTKTISEELHNAIETCSDELADIDLEVDANARGIVLVVDEITRHFIKWVQDASVGLDTAPPRGSSELLNSLDRLVEQIKNNSLPKPPPITQLKQQGVSDLQIAITYGWKDETGSPDVQKVFEEIETPGTHYKPESWVHPANRVIQADIDAQWSQRSPRQAFFRKTQNANPPAPAIPSIDELFEAGAPPAQICRLHKIELEELEIIAQEKGFSMAEDRFVRPANSTAALMENQAAAAGKK
jgi:hypothetical protein